MGTSIGKLRKNLSGDGLFKIVKNSFKKVPDTRSGDIKIPLSDALMSAFAMFSLKEPSLLKFDGRCKDEYSLKHIYRIGRVPSDTHLRTLLDPVNPQSINSAFTDIFRHLQRGKALEKFVYMDQYYLASLDGTGYFSSYFIQCPHCQEKEFKNGTTQFSHQMLGAVIVHPDVKEVIPLAPEMILKQDGQTKNDCERNAAKRLLSQLRKDHPKLKMIIVEDALASNAPHIKELRKHNLEFILGVKPGDHKFLFKHIEEQQNAGNVQSYEIQQGDTTHKFKFINQVPLNASNADLRINFLEYWEIKPKKTQHFTWVTDFQISTENTYELMRGGRARWKIENETFNTLKNQGYHFEHNFGHGKENLSANFALIMMLAFLVDQVQQHCCHLFQAAWKKVKRKKYLWEEIRSKFSEYDVDSMEQILKMIAFGHKKMRASDLLDDTS